MKLRKIVILIFTVMLGVASLTACTQNNGNQKGEMKLTEQEKKVIRKQEEALALFLVNNFEDVKKIEFTFVSEKTFGVGRGVFLTVNDKVVISTDLKDSYDINHYGFSYHNNSEILKRKDTPTNFTKLAEAQLEVIYYGENNVNR